MARKSSRATKVRKLLAEGVSPKEIAAKLKMKPQTVYNIRYYESKKQGVGALSETITITASGEGIATVPRRRGRPPKSQTPIVVPPQTEKQDAPVHVKASSDTKAWGVILVGVVVVAIIIAITL